jgi:hypothetical protein
MNLYSLSSLSLSLLGCLIPDTQSLSNRQVGEKNWLSRGGRVLAVLSVSSLYWILSLHYCDWSAIATPREFYEYRVRPFKCLHVIFIKLWKPYVAPEAMVVLSECDLALGSESSLILRHWDLSFSHVVLILRCLKALWFEGGCCLSKWFTLLMMRLEAY